MRKEALAGIVIAGLAGGVQAKDISPYTYKDQFDSEAAVATYKKAKELRAQGLCEILVWKQGRDKISGSLKQYEGWFRCHRALEDMKDDGSLRFNNKLIGISHM